MSGIGNEFDLVNFKMSFSGKSTTSSVTNVPENYFSIDDILATQERIPCTFEQQVFNLGYLDPGSDAEHIPAGAKLELPLWLVKALCSRKKQTVSIELPKAYKEGYREILSADANVVDLHKLGPYYYAFGMHLLEFEHLDSPDIARSLLSSFQKRFRKIMDDSQNSLNEDTTKLKAKLDELERALFDCGQQGLNDFQDWETRKSDQLKTSQMVLNHLKRKRPLDDV